LIPNFSRNINIAKHTLYTIAKDDSPSVPSGMNFDKNLIGERGRKREREKEGTGEEREGSKIKK